MATENQIKYWKGLKGRKLSSETCKKMSENKKGIIPKNHFKKGHKGYGKKGEDHYNWKGGISRGWAYRIITKLICQECGASNCKLTIHHIDKNPKNNEISNLRVLCYKCHIGQIHNQERMLVKIKDKLI